MGLIARMAAVGTASRRRMLPLAAAAAAILLMLIGGVLALTYSSHHRQPDLALDPIGPASEPNSGPSTGISDSVGGLGLSAMPDATSGDAGMSTNPTNPAISASAPAGGAGLPAFQLPPLQLPAPPQLPPPGDWSTLVQPFIDSQNNAAAANVGGAVTGAAAGVGAAAVNSAAVLLGDLILYNAYTNTGAAALSSLAPAAALEAVGAGLSQLPPPPDFSGLSAAFAAAATAPPVLGLTPAQLPPPPPLPTPEQLAALTALPFLIPALPPLPSIGLPPPPPLIGLPPPPPLFGLPLPPPIPLPSITRLLGLPF